MGVIRSSITGNILQYGRLGEVGSNLCACLFKVAHGISMGRRRGRGAGRAKDNYSFIVLFMGAFKSRQSGQWPTACQGAQASCQANIVHGNWLTGVLYGMDSLMDCGTQIFKITR